MTEKIYTVGIECLIRNRLSGGKIGAESYKDRNFSSMCVRRKISIGVLCTPTRCCFYVYFNLSIPILFSRYISLAVELISCGGSSRSTTTNPVNTSL